MGQDAEYVHPVTARATLIEGRFSAVLLLASEATGGRLSLVEHPLAPRALGSPVHTHRNEDEYSVILAGRVGAQLRAQVVHGGPGDVIAKPRGIPHAFWNAGDEPARVLEIITPGSVADLPQLASVTRNYPYVGCCGQPGGESSQSSWRPYGVRSRMLLTNRSRSTPRAVVQ